MNDVCNSTVGKEEPNRWASKRPLCAVLEIWMGDGCPLAEVESSARDIFVRQVAERCRVDVVVETDSLEVVHYEKQIQDECVGSIFARYDCVPHITNAEEGTITVMTFPPRRELLSSLVSEMREREFDVSVKQLMSLENYEQTGRQTPLLCDVSLLTSKEREAVDLAVTSGYYAESNGTSLQELADELGISKSALSTRLSSAESKVMRNIFSRGGNGST